MTRLRLFAHDESRFGLLPLHRHRITLKGIQPVASVTFQFEAFYLYGAVEPTTGDSFFLELPALNATNFQVFLEEFAAADPTNLLVLVLDNGRAHTAATLILPANVCLLFLPPYAPELNPIERLWRALKDAVAEARPETLAALSDMVARNINNTTPQGIRSLTSYRYFVQAA